MIKIVGLVRKRPDMSHADFRAYGLERHSQLERASLQSNPVRRIVANFWQHDIVGTAPFDGMVELYYDSMDDYLKVWSSGHDDEMRADEANFCDPAYRKFFIVEEVEMGRKAD